MGLPYDAEMMKTRDMKVKWPGLKEQYEKIFKSKTRKQWEDIFDGTDACCTPVLTQLEIEQRGDDNRAAVDLVDTPAKPTSEVDGKGWWSQGMVAGTHNEEVLAEWLNEESTVSKVWAKVKGLSKL